MKVEDYNPNEYIVNFLKEVNEFRQTSQFADQMNEVKIGAVGRKYIKLTDGSSVWGFISRVDGELKGHPIKKGDLLKAASYSSPAKHSRGNITDGTASYGMYGPNYLK